MVVEGFKINEITNGYKLEVGSICFGVVLFLGKHIVLIFNIYKCSINFPMNYNPCRRERLKFYEKNVRHNIS